MLAAAEAAMDAGAEDDAERARNRARLYAPPVTSRRRLAPRSADEPRPKPPGGGVSMEHAQSLLAQLAAQDAQLTSRRNS
ncbi:hypothetical protein B0E38_01842 [Streptomyces sp. 111WW2]|uniref:hypothetical protein n=1 Tax=Streptomyces sp. 111WW2 TaxID=1945515 RepID=UPI000D0C9541|nr:hypothetical protein [Streptomyces sp. 111WW2]PSK57997.1 hypothetical protein B0E38_01842 [Streptomyces sp. 111WW2]